MRAQAGPRAPSRITGETGSRDSRGRSGASARPSPALVRYLGGESLYEDFVRSATDEERRLVNSPVRVAIVGCGRHSRSALQPNLARLPSFDIVGVCDLDAGLAADCARRFGARAPFTDFAKMLDQCRPEAVIVVGTPRMHYELGLEVAARGMNLFVEKPPAPSAEEAWRLARRVAAAGHAGMVGTMLRHTTALRLLKDLMRRGGFGDALFCSGRLFAPGPVSDDYYRLGSAPQAYLGSQAIHLIDGMRFLMGEVAEVTARLGTRGDAFSFAAGLTFTSGAVGVLGCTSHAAALETEIVVGGTGGQTAIVTNAKELRVIGSTPASGALGGYADVPSRGWNQGYTYAGTLRHGYLEELHAFAIATRFRRRIGPTLDDGAVSTGLVEALWKSCKSGRAVRPA